MGIRRIVVIALVDRLTGPLTGLRPPLSTMRMGRNTKIRQSLTRLSTSADRNTSVMTPPEGRECADVPVGVGFKRFQVLSVLCIPTVLHGGQEQISPLILQYSLLRGHLMSNVPTT